MDLGRAAGGGDKLGEEGGNGAVGVGGKGSHGDKAVHIGRAVARCGPEAGEERPPAPELDRRGQKEEQDQMQSGRQKARTEEGGGNADGNDGEAQKEGGGEAETDPTVVTIGVFLSTVGRRIVPFVDPGVVSCVDHGLLKDGRGHAEVVDGGLVCGEVDGHIDHAFDILKGALDPGDARGAAHAGDGEGETPRFYGVNRHGRDCSLRRLLADP